MTNIDRDKAYSIEEAIKLAKDSSKAKFDETLEAHFNLGIDHKKPEQAIRVTAVLPNGTGKEVKVAVFASEEVPNADIQLTEEDLNKINKGDLRPKVDFDVIVAEPRFMPKLAMAAKVLGPQGMMPNPKSGTVTEEVEKTVEQIKKGKIVVRNEVDAPIVHVPLGKKSFEDDKLVENFQEIVSTIRSNRPQKVKPENYIKSCFICTTMGKAVQVDLN